jgi:hypothetical protein
MRQLIQVLRDRVRRWHRKHGQARRPGRRLGVEALGDRVLMAAGIAAAAAPVLAVDTPKANDALVRTGGEVEVEHGGTTTTTQGEVENEHGTTTTPPVGQISLPGAASAITHSDEQYGNFVTQAYQKYLGRTPQTSETNGWVGAMRSGLSDERLEANFIGSVEYIANHGGQGAGWVTGMYKDLLGRAPAQAEVDVWVNALNHGTSPRDVAYGFAASAEREGQRVQDDYSRFLGRPATQAEVNAWVDAFEHGASNEDVVAGFVGSQENFDRHGDDVNTWTAGAYQSILGRQPSQIETSHWHDSLLDVKGSGEVEVGDT